MSAPPWIGCIVVPFNLVHLVYSIHTCKPVSFQLWAYGSISWMLAHPWGWGECACVLATQSTKGEGTVGTGVGCMGAGRASLLLLCQFTETARWTLTESLPATLRPGDSLQSQPCLAKWASPTLVARTEQNSRVCRVCTCACGWRVHTNQLSCPLCHASPLIWGHNWAQGEIQRRLALP